MSENIIFLITGSVIGLLASLLTSWFQHKLAMKQQEEEWKHEETQETIRSARKLIGSLGPGDSPFPRLSTISNVEICKLYVEAGPNQGARFSIRKHVIVLGRSKELCDYVLSDQKIGAAHVKLIIADSCFVLEDISGEGVRVNDAWIVRPVLLKDNDLIEFGGTAVRFSLTESSHS